MLADPRGGLGGVRRAGRGPRRSGSAEYDVRGEVRGDRARRSTTCGERSAEIGRGGVRRAGRGPRRSGSAEYDVRGEVRGDRARRSTTSGERTAEIGLGGVRRAGRGRRRSGSAEYDVRGEARGDRAQRSTTSRERPAGMRVRRPIRVASRASGRSSNQLSAGGGTQRSRLDSVVFEEKRSSTRSAIATGSRSELK